MSSSPRHISFAVPDIGELELSAVTRVLNGPWITTGSECELFESELAAFLEVPYVVCLSSCTASIETAYAYLGLPRGARVGVTTWTFVSSALAPYRNGALPVLLDVDPDTLNASPAAVEAALRIGLDALVLVHFGGVPASPDIYDLCRDAGVPVIEDAAHTFGSRQFDGYLAGRRSVAACFSFYATKNLTTAEGGALATTDPELASFARSYRLHGLSSDAWKRYEPGGRATYDLVMPGIKGNLPDVLAAIGRAQLARFPDLQEHRRALVRRYREGLSRIEGLRVVPARECADSADHLMVVVLPEMASRDGVTKELAGCGIATSIHFTPLHRFPWFREHAEVGPLGVDVAESLADRVLSLPLYSSLAVPDIDRICQTLHEALA